MSLKCPSVRPSFPDFSQLALRYRFETWYIHSVGHTICRVWVSSQLDHFDLIYSQKHMKPMFCNYGLINQEKPFQFRNINGPLYTSWHKFCFLQKSYFKNIGVYFCTLWIFKLFWYCYQIVVGYRFETWYIHIVGDATDLNNLLYSQS